MHDQALVELGLPATSTTSGKAAGLRAGAFFAAAVSPIEATHRVAHEHNTRVAELNGTLRRRSEDLAAANDHLKQEISQRKIVEESLRKSERHYADLLGQSRQMQEQLRLLSRELLSAQEEERKKISRDLHDVIAQILTSINVRLAILKTKAARKATGLNRTIALTQRLVGRSVNLVHRFARELRPAALDDLGLIPALRTFVRHFTAETGIRVSLAASSDIEQVSSDQRTVLYRVAQEALTNAARHAKASRAEVILQRQDGAIWMSIRDNGKGFRPGPLPPSSNGRHLGLLGMRERVEMVGGTLTVTSARGRGTTVSARLPAPGRKTERGAQPQGPKRLGTKLG